MSAWVSCAALCLLSIGSVRAVYRTKRDDKSPSHLYQELTSFIHGGKRYILEDAQRMKNFAFSAFPYLPECATLDDNADSICPRARYGISCNRDRSLNFTDSTVSKSVKWRNTYGISRMPKQFFNPFMKYNFAPRGVPPPWTWKNKYGAGYARPMLPPQRQYQRALSGTPGVACADPGETKNGFKSDTVKVSGGLNTGATIEYSCNPDFYLVGSFRITCLQSGTWSDQKPQCMPAAICTDPGTPTNGYVNFLPPLLTPGSVRAAERLPILEGKPMPQEMMGAVTDPTFASYEDDDDDQIKQTGNKTQLKPGQYKVGSRAIFNCEQKYYRLEGSKTRRCLTKGVWSGRQPVCVPICGKWDNLKEPNILNGTPTEIGKWPMQAGVAMYIDSFNKWFIQCGGTLISEEWVLTAGHCVCKPGSTVLEDHKKFIIYLGKYYRDDAKDDNQVQARTVSRTYVHPDYNPHIFDSDIALIFLSTPVKLTMRVQPACLPNPQRSEQNLQENSTGIVPGWGKNGTDTFLWEMQDVELPVIPNSKCEESYDEANMPMIVTENMFCSGFYDGHADTCSGDSGGPWMFYDRVDKRYVVEGIVSWGSPDGCGIKNEIGGFTRVYKFLNFLHLFL